MISPNHQNYINSLIKKENTFEFELSKHLLNNSIYWILTSLFLLGEIPPDNKKYVEIIKNSQNIDGGFGSFQGHDSHILQSLSAVQSLLMLDQISLINKTKLIDYIAKLQLPNGSFCGDEFGHVDVRFVLVIQDLVMQLFLHYLY